MSLETQDFIIDKLLVTSVKKSIDFTGTFDTLIIYENLFSNYISGEITIRDTQNWIQNLPIIGDEKIEIIIKYPDLENRKKILNVNKKNRDKFKIEGNIYKITNRIRDDIGQSIEMYTLHFYHDIRLKNDSQRVSKTYKNNKISEYVKSICKDYLNIEIRNEDLDQTLPETVDINIPNLNPLTAINFLAGLSYNDEKGLNNNYFFYQNKDKFKFKSLEKIIEIEKPIANIKFSTNVNVSNYEIDKKNEIDKKIEEEVERKVEQRMAMFQGIMGGTVLPGTGEPVKKILNSFLIGEKVSEIDIIQAENYSMINSFNNIESSIHGYFGYTNYSHDILTKSIDIKEINYSDLNLIGEKKSLNKKDTKTKKFLLNDKKYAHNTKIYSKSSNNGKEKSNYIKSKIKNEGTGSSYIHNTYLIEEVRETLKNTKKERFLCGPKFKIIIPGTLLLDVGDIIILDFPSFEDSNDGKRYIDDKIYSGNYLIYELKHTLFKGNTWRTEIKAFTDSLKTNQSVSTNSTNSTNSTSE